MWDVKNKYSKKLKTIIIDAILCAALAFVFVVLVFWLAASDGDSEYAAKLYLIVIPILAFIAIVFLVIAAIFGNALSAVKEIEYSTTFTKTLSCYKIKVYTFAVSKYRKENVFLKLLCKKGGEKRVLYYIFSDKVDLSRASSNEAATIKRLKRLITEKDITVECYKNTSVIEDGYKIK